MSGETQWLRIGGASDAGHETGPGIRKFMIRNGETAGLQQATQMLGTGSFVAWWIDGIEGNQGSGQFQGVGDISRRQLIHLYEGMPAGHAAKKPIMADPKKPKKSRKLRRN